MKFQKKALALVLSMAMMLSLGACGSSGTNKSAAASNSSGAAAEEKAVVIKFGIEGSESSNDNKVAVKIKELVEANEAANIEVQVFGDGTLGSLRDLVEGLSLNTVGMTLVGASGFENICPNMGVYNSWVIDSPEEAIELYESEVGGQLRDQLLNENGIRLLSYCNCVSGTTYLWGNKPMTTLADYKGVDIRTNNSASNIKALGAFGANPVVLGFADVYNGIETGLIDMTWGSIPVVISGGQGEVLSYIMPAPANFTAGMCAVSESLWGTLSENQQKVLMDAVVEACQVYGNELAAETSAAADNMLAEAGIEKVEMVESEYDEMCRLVSDAIFGHLSETCDANILEAARAVVAD